MKQRAAVSNCRIKAFDSIKDMCWSRRRRRTMKIVDECDESSHNYLSVKVRFFATRNQLQDSAAEKTDWANEARFISRRVMLSAREALRWRTGRVR